MIDLLFLVALYTATTVGLIALGYWWGYGNGQTDGYDAGQIDMAELEAAEADGVQ